MRQELQELQIHSTMLLEKALCQDIIANQMDSNIVSRHTPFIGTKDTERYL